ncbi:hypothetical protein SEA_BRUTONGASTER_120 [Gordonia phage BrutonGaster]|uniref:dATP/dGTP diphosphohydrolase N-terminal domain-containing protein n=1 Tax=Gordonia phage BrutonGaster TaxID=2530116 RepID=A0A482JHC6_9CAUD|nr:hypothetical protein HOV26_gp062 [Gordonia phage BrutonGaster]QBP33335.1 hypothetical protein SEA_BRUTONGASTER_120 [Gordonia phage BrutonGaster]
MSTIETNDKGQNFAVADTGGKKEKKLARYDLIPAGPLLELAELYGRGASKYADRNWELGYDWSLSFAAMNRHAWQFWDGENYDPETGAAHLASVAWHALALLQFMQQTEKYGRFDDRPSTEAIAQDDTAVDGDDLDASDWVVHDESMDEFAAYIQKLNGYNKITMAWHENEVTKTPGVTAFYDPTAAVYEGLPDAGEEDDVDPVATSPEPPPNVVDNLGDAWPKYDYRDRTGWLHRYLFKGERRGWHRRHAALNGEWVPVPKYGTPERDVYDRTYGPFTSTAPYTGPNPDTEIR